MKHHLLKEEHQKSSCIYCNNDLKGLRWHSVFESLLHYKTIECKRCGKENRIKVDFHGSGHDSWDGTNAWMKDFNVDKSKECEKDDKVTILEAKIKDHKRVD